jgi:hypothetical protein
MAFSSIKSLALVGLLASSVSASPASANVKRGATPGLIADPNTTPYCSWWYDNTNGAVACSDLTFEWAITTAQFLRWVCAPLLRRS